MENLPDNSRIWIFNSDRFLTDKEQDLLSENLGLFIKKWAAHGKELYGSFEIRHDNFVIIGVDESKITASGCSIDTLTRFMKDQSKLIGADFFNRMKMLVSKNGELKRINFSEINDYADWEIFNPTITNLKDFSTKWLIPVSDFIH